MRTTKRNPWYLYAGSILMILSWYFNWHLTGLRTHYLFFPLWFGYILVIDALVYYRKGTSLISRNPRKFFLLFFMSVPVWWLFEGLNLRTQNWYYLGREQFTDLEYFLYASLCFSTVIPAVFVSAELISSFRALTNWKRGPRISSGRKSIFFLLFLGVATLILLLIWPKYFYVFLWLSIFLILDSVNHLLGNRSLVAFTNVRDWRPLLSMALGCLLCGFFWEMWNYLAFPKWKYNTPGVEFLYIFEMPLLGYLGYIPFAFELFAFYHLFAGKKDKAGQDYYLLSEY